MAGRVGVADLEWVLEWLESYEPIDEEDKARQVRVIQRIRDEIEGRYEAKAKRELAKERKGA